MYYFRLPPGGANNEIIGLGLDKGGFIKCDLLLIIIVN